MIDDIETAVDKAKELATDRLLENGEPQSDFKPKPLREKFLTEFGTFSEWYPDAVTDHAGGIYAVIQKKLSENDDADFGRFMREVIMCYINRNSED